MIRAAVLALSISMTTSGVGIPPTPPTPADVQFPAITGSVHVDERIRQLAEARGYRLRPTATAPLVGVDGHSLSPGTAAAWNLLKSAARADGHRLHLVAGFRDHATQRRLFLSRLGGSTDHAIDSTLRWSAPPGYSKHHTGRAVDITQVGTRPGRFASTDAYRWLVADNYRHAHRYGFAPSYPPNGTGYGPEPEAWEWIFVGFPKPDLAGTRPT